MDACLHIFWQHTLQSWLAQTAVLLYWAIWMLILCCRACFCTSSATERIINFTFKLLMINWLIDWLQLLWLTAWSLKVHRSVSCKSVTMEGAMQLIWARWWHILLLTRVELTSSARSACQIAPFLPAARKRCYYRPPPLYTDYDLTLSQHGSVTLIHLWGLHQWTDGHRCPKGELEGLTVNPPIFVDASCIQRHLVLMISRSIFIKGSRGNTRWLDGWGAVAGSTQRYSQPQPHQGTYCSKQSK